MSGEKTEKPTEQRKKKARQDGSGTARTADFGAWGGMLIASVTIPMVAENGMATIQEVFVRGTGMFADPDPDKAMRLLKTAMLDGLLALAPLAIGLFAFALLAAAAQGGIRPATKMFKPDFKKANPFKGLKRMLGPQSLWEGAKSLLKVVVLGVVMYQVLKDLVPALLSSGSMPVQTLIATIADAALSIIQATALAGLILAAADYAMVRRRTGKSMRMSKEEIKEEHKKTEGDPHVKGQIRARQHEMARNRMMADVPKADVVMVNPTHVAVALRYDPAKGAPRVVAKGAGAVATKIRELAGEHRVPMVQDVPLARALYAGCDIGDEIPAEFFGAVARVLAFVMMLKSKGSAAGVHRNVMAGAGV